jgi:hypothetical protein
MCIRWVTTIHGYEYPIDVIFWHTYAWAGISILKWAQRHIGRTKGMRWKILHWAYIQPDSSIRI